MKRDETIKLMQQACDPDKKPAWHNGFWTITQVELERFADLVLKAEREWLGLTYEERDEICKDFVGDDGRVGAYLSLALEVEVRLTEKNRSAK
jgi:hypothetical protein